MAWMSDADWARVQAERAAKNREWEARKAEWTLNAEIKRRLVSRMQHLAANPQEPGAGDEVGQLAAEFKGTGFAGKEINQQLADDFYGARNRFYELRNQHWEQVKAQWHQAAIQRQQMIGELRAIVSTGDTSRDASQRLKELHVRWKQAGFAGKEETKALNTEYYQLRDTFYEESKRKWEEWNIQADQNRDFARRMVDRMTSFANEDNPKGWSNDVRALIEEFRNLKGPMRREHREQLNREFWAEKDRFYARRGLQQARPNEFHQGDYQRSDTQRTVGRGPENLDQAKWQFGACPGPQFTDRYPSPAAAYRRADGPRTPAHCPRETRRFTPTP